MVEKYFGGAPRELRSGSSCMVGDLPVFPRTGFVAEATRVSLKLLGAELIS